MHRRNNIEVHSKNATNDSRGRQQAGHNCHHLHHLIRFSIEGTQVQILEVHHHITVVFAEVISLYYMIINVFEVFCNSIIQEITSLRMKPLIKSRTGAMFLFKTMSSFLSWLMRARLLLLL